MRDIPVLEIQVANACNLTCESCSHFSNNGHRGLLGLDEAEAWMKPWTRRIRPQTFRLLGGEPTINPCLTELVLLARDMWPESRIGLTTNGFFLHKHPRLPAALEEADVMVTLTVHDPAPQSWRSSGPFTTCSSSGDEPISSRWRSKSLGNAGPAGTSVTEPTSCPCRTASRGPVGRTVPASSAGSFSAGASGSARRSRTSGYRRRRSPPSTRSGTITSPTVRSSPAAPTPR